VTSIDKNAFGGCSGLTSVTIGNSVTSISESAFKNCSGLTSVTIPNSVTSIGNSAFDGCRSLISVAIGNSVTFISYNAFQNCACLTSITFRCVDVSSWFSGFKTIQEVIIGNEVTSIDEGAFSGCLGLTSVTIGNSITEIKTNTFYNTNIESITIGSGVLSIADNAFSYENGVGSRPVKVIWLTNTPPNGYKYLGGTINYVANEQYDFTNQTVYPSLSSIFEVEGVKYVPVSLADRTCDVIDCTYDKAVENIQIGKTVSYRNIEMAVRQIRPYSMYQNTFVKDVTLEHEGEIGEYAFYGCSNIQKLSISNKGTIKDYAFSGIASSFDAYINKGIGKSVFENNRGLKAITLGESVDSIGESAFSGCTQLKSIAIPDAVNSINAKAFSGCSSLEGVKIGANVRRINKNAFENCSSLTDLQVGEKVGIIETEAFNGCKALPAVKIPQSVTQIGDNAFNGCTSLKELIMEEKTGDFANDVLSLGSNGKDPLFSSCPLDSVYIGRNISYPTESSKGYSPFYRNTSLRSVVVTDRETEISPNEFYGCTNLKSIKIGDGVTTIGDWAFSGCSGLQSFAFGRSVESIGKEAFSDCTAITSIRSRAIVPPVCGSQALDDLNKWDCTLYVPVGYVNAYMAADQWKEFFFVQEGDLVTFPVTSIALSRESLTLKVNETETLVATLLPENATDKSVTWTTSDEAIATIDANGVVTGKKAGKAVITAASVSNPDVTASCEVTVLQPVLEVKLDTTHVAFNEIGITYQLTATVLPEDAYDKSVTWASSDEAVCTVSESGLITSVGAGIATITVTTVDGGKTATCEVTVFIPVKTITLNAETLQLLVGENKQLVATILPENATDKSLVWSSSDESIATVDVDGEGVVTGKKAGTAKITATSVSNPDVKANCEVIVSQPVQSVTLSETSILFEEIGKTHQLTATVLPEDASNKSVVWASSDEAVCTISEEGLVTAVGAGTATVTVTTVNGGKTATCEVTVVIPVKEIALSAETLELSVGESKKLEATVTPENATDKSVAWTSSDETVAAVDGEGNVKALKAGTATITATSVSNPDVSASCEITVIQPVESVTLDMASIVLEEIGATYQLMATVLPEDASEKAVTWASSDEAVCTVSAKGLVTAVSAGTATVTVTTVDGGKTATCEVAVIIPVTEIALSNDTLQMQVGDKRQLAATVSPENATDKSLEWSSSDEAVAKVDANGQVEAVAEGTALITVKSVAYPDVMAICDVTVIEDNGIMMLQVGEMLHVRAIYDVTGRKLERLQQGMNILLLKDGSTRKIRIE